MMLTDLRIVLIKSFYFIYGPSISSDGDTLLHAAAASRNNKEDVMEFLLSLDPDLLETENRKHRTPLHVAAYGIIFIFSSNKQNEAGTKAQDNYYKCKLTLMIFVIC